VPYLLIATFEYDALGRRIRATYYNRWGNIVDDTLYYYDGQRVVAEYDYDETAGTQTLARWFVDGPLYVDEHVKMHDATTGDDYFYLPQELYSVAGLVDEDGELVEAHAYDAYGDVRIFDLTGPTPTELDVSAVGNPYYFTGRRRDPIHNPLASPVSYRPLYHYRARAYDPLHGRFLQRDPAEYVDGMNLYEYAGSRPLLLRDWSGQSWSKDRDNENLYRPVGRSASLAALVRTVMRDRGITGLSAEKDWACLWPVEPEGGLSTGWKRRLERSYNGTMNLAGCCLKFDVSNLLPVKGAGAHISAYIVSDIPPLRGNLALPQDNAGGIMTKLKTQSVEGRSPVSEVRVFGHAGAGAALREARTGGAEFSVEALAKAATVARPDDQTYANALKRIGPPRCWFAVDASLRLYGCKTKKGLNAWVTAHHRGQQSRGFTKQSLQADLSTLNTVWYVDDGGRRLSPPYTTYSDLESNTQYFHMVSP
jgi:RHS repeat-associated protein